MTSYKDKIAPNPDVDMIHFALEDEDPALEWAKKEGFPWPHIMKDDMSKFFAKYVGNAVPTYVMIDREGEILAKGKGACFAKAAELAPQT